MFRIFPPQPPESPAAAAAGNHASQKKRKRRPAGTPGTSFSSFIRESKEIKFPTQTSRSTDPDAEVVSLSPRTLLESDRYVCDICNQGFQRDQNLQMHRRRHKVPWKLLKRESPSPEAAAVPAKKRVFVCPEQSCLHHDPCHALGDLVGIKKHFRRKHSAHRQWACSRCSKAYAVHSDFKAHLKTCGTRGHSCDCGRVFSRVESFIEHQDSCNAGRGRPELCTPQQRSSLPHMASSPSPPRDTIAGAPPPPSPASQAPPLPLFVRQQPQQNIELQLLPPPSPHTDSGIGADAEEDAELHLSIGRRPSSPVELRSAMMKKATADAARVEARRHVELAEREMAAARSIRKQAQAELEKASALRAAASRQINAILRQITCLQCQQLLHPEATQTQTAPFCSSPDMAGFLSSAGNDDGERSIIQPEV
ncbi:Zinc finger protein MAGPIE [Apostasia shenzhenica]|uniref:Zinc finger protein MAGPIE n=1 Tax=Apostasia shenzhenica TaxID=1088818 RepID=A0A2I0BCX5_9ASPA|nr:Zinc finger protein MAGPIE [Apostasia shenzhenica]